MKGVVIVSCSFFVFVAGFTALLVSIIKNASLTLHSIAATVTAFGVIIFISGIKKIKNDFNTQERKKYKRRWTYVLPLVLLGGGMLVWTKFTPLPIGLEIIRYATISIIGIALGDFLDSFIGQK